MTRLIENQQHLAMWARQQNGSLDMAVAFWGEGAIEELGLDAREKNFRVLLDLSAGASNPKVVKALLKLAPNGVRCVPRLHAKAFIGDEEMVVGSANASANGLGSEGNEANLWHELGIICDEPKVIRDAKAWFRHLWAGSETISAGMLKKATKNWLNRQKMRPREGTNESNILAAATSNPSRFKNLGRFVVVTTANLSNKGKTDAAGLEEKTGHPVFCWENWDDIPTDAHLICFSDYEHTQIIKDVPCVVYAPSERRRYRNLVLVEPSHLIDQISGDEFTVDRITDWRPALERARSSVGKKAWRSRGGLCMDLGEFAERFGKSD